MDIFDVQYWAGTEQTLTAYLAELQRVANDGTLSKRAYDDSGDETTRAPRLFTKQGDIGVVSIKGRLNNSDSWINPYIGAVGYPEIRAALIHAATAGGVKAIVLDINSGGGLTSGMFDTADLIATIDKKVMPVHAFGDGMVGSAAYALGVAARTITITKSTEAGSIGVMGVHADMSKMYSDEGIKHTVFRSGKYKAQGLPVEPLSDIAKTMFQEGVDKMAGLFNAHVASHRGVSVAVADEKLGQGRVFLGQDALDVGLVDGIKSFDDFMSKLQGGIDSQKSRPEYGGNFGKGNTLKVALTEQQIAALAAAGVPVEAVQAPAAPAAPAAAAPAASDTDTDTDNQSAAEQPAAPAAPAEQAADKGVVDLLQSQLAAAQAQVVALSVDLKTATAAADALKASGEKLLPIVRGAVSNLRIALGGTAAGVEALSEDALLAEHANLSAQFNTKFKSGGVAAPSATADEKPASAVVDPLRKARLAATRNTK